MLLIQISLQQSQGLFCNSNIQQWMARGRHNIRVSAGCEESTALSSANSADAVSTKASDSKAFAYPNPAKNSVTLDFSAKQNGKYIFELSELNGRTLLHKEMNALKGSNNTRIDVSGLARGIYFINVISPGKKLNRH